ncbi:DUF6873 family GME fold protein [Clostridium sp. B9]|uniref:DUF6873 family GME fold protein n=1 Tax=Clostridium sp. B9 TaxID=3423224 RepID=UPI003D2F02B5
MRTCFVDYRITKTEEDNLRKLGVNIIKVPKHPNLYEAIDAHPDIQINILDENSLLIAKNSPKELIESIPKSFNIIKSSLPLEKKYPNNVYLNAVNLKETFIHNTNFTDPVLFEKIKDKKIINIKQGYSKCSIAIVSEKALITSDRGIYNSLKESNLDVLLIPSGDISLPGLNYGFIGGTCGLISPKELAFFGNLERHAYGDSIIAFLKKHGVKPIYLSKDKLVDRGSILTI